MEQIVHGKTFELYIPSSLILQKVKALALILNSKFSAQDERPLLVGILNGSFVFMADLIRELEFQCTLQFIRIESYQGLQTTGVVKMEADVSPKWKNKHVIVVEDIIDTGHTMNRFLPVLHSHDPKSVTLCALLFKEDALEVPVTLDHYCFKIPKYFVLGYGLDYDGVGRNFKDIYKLKE